MLYISKAKYTKKSRIIPFSKNVTYFEIVYTAFLRCHKYKQVSQVYAELQLSN